MKLIANDEVNIVAGQDTQYSHGKNSSSGWSIGADINLSTGFQGFGVSVNGGKGSNRGDGVEHIESTVSARDELTIISGGDTNIIGSQVSGNKVIADIGGDLNIESLQDSNNYHEKQTNWNVSASTTGSVSGGYSKQKIDSEYDSVQDQAGIYAGEGGFDIRVEGNTDLKGAVIASEADADKNKISTGTISFSDIENEAEWDSKTTGISGNNKTPDNDKRDQGITPNVGGSSGEDDSTTKSAISEGTIEIRDEENQKQDIDDLSRDTENANNPLKPIFDKDKILEKEQAAALFGEMGFEVVGDIIEKNNWSNDDPRAIALHGLIGGIMAEINGGQFGDGLTTAAINKLIIAKLAESGLVDGAELRWISGLLGLALDGHEGAGIADSATKNNDIPHLVLPVKEIIVGGLLVVIILPLEDGTYKLVDSTGNAIIATGEQLKNWGYNIVGDKIYTDEDYYITYPGGISSITGDDGVARYWLDGIQLTEVEKNTYIAYNYQPGDPVNDSSEERKQKNGRPNKPKDDIPDWVKISGAWPYAKESGKDFALRVMRWAQSNGQSYKTGKGPGSLYNQLKKWVDTHF